MASAGNEETSSCKAPLKMGRKRSRNLKERKSMRNFYAIIKEKEEEIRADLLEIEGIWREERKFLHISDLLKKNLSFRPPKPGSILSKNSTFFSAYEFLTANLIQKGVLPDERDPFFKLPKGQGVKCAKNLSFFLRHGIAKGRYSPRDGSVEIEEVERSLGMDREKILVAVSPEYDEEKKRRFVVIKLVHPDGSISLRIAALGGHSVAVSSPPGHYILGKESLLQLCPLVHNTSAIKEIKESGFLSQQGRQGGINLCSKVNNYRLKSSHQIHVDAENSTKKGFTFFGNRFSEVVFCTGVWEDGRWTGKIPLKYLSISQRR